MQFKDDQLAGYFNSIVEREAIFVRKELLGLPREQWTNDKTFATYRFCNVHRCYDKTFVLLTRIDALWKRNYGTLMPAGLRTMLRWSSVNPFLQCVIDALNNIHSPVTLMLRPVLKELNATGEPYTFISKWYELYACGIVPLTTASFYVKRFKDDIAQLHSLYAVGTALEEKIVRAVAAGTPWSVKNAVAYLQNNCLGIGPFVAYCIVSDWMYLQPTAFCDLYTWAAYGPGAFNGVNRMVVTPVDKREYITALRRLLGIWTNNSSLVDRLCSSVNIPPNEITALCEKRGYPDLISLLTHPMMLDVEHWLCEYEKYARGRAKLKYKE